MDRVAASRARVKELTQYLLTVMAIFRISMKQWMVSLLARLVQGKNIVIQGPGFTASYLTFLRNTKAKSS
jgi:hypothetical protein